jgi:glucose-1-phosphate adenylyltransferase
MHEIFSRTVTFVLAGGRGARLAPLTRDRSKPAVSFGDRRIIDFALANCLRSKLAHPFVITQYQAAHLSSHIRQWWLQQCVSDAGAMTAPVCRPAPKREYLGTADALLRNIHLLERNTQYVMVLSADHIYDMDYRELLQFHVDQGADATLAAIVYGREAAQQFGIVEVSESDRITSFEEKPAQPKELHGQPGKVLANMGIYVFHKDVLVDALRRDANDPNSVHDIGRNVLPDLVKHKSVSAFRFEDPVTGKPGYWKDVGTIDSYYEASMEWLNRLPATHRLAGSRSVIAEGVRVHRSAEVIDSILLPGVDVGPGARIHRAILDENVQVMPYSHIGYGTAENETSQHTPKGIVVVPAGSVVSVKSGKISLKNSSGLRHLQEWFA